MQIEFALEIGRLRARDQRPSAAQPERQLKLISRVSYSLYAHAITLFSLSRAKVKGASRGHRCILSSVLRASGGFKKKEKPLWQGLRYAARINNGL